MARILVADDEKEVRDRLKEKLIEAGHEVDVVFDGIGALAQAKTGSFDVLILDCFMPVSGIEVLEKLRNDPEYEAAKDLPVIGITDMDKGADIEEFVHLGANGAWSKDLSDDKEIPDLLALIDKVLP